MFDYIVPTEILKKYIKGYYIVEINKHSEYMPWQRVFPTGSISLVFHYGSPSKFKEKEADEYIEPNLIICGQQTFYYDLSLSGKTGMIIIAFKPYGANTFFNFPVSNLLNRNLSMHDLYVNQSDELEDKLLNLKNNKERITLLENFLIDKITENIYFERIKHATEIIKSSKGHVKIQTLAQEVCFGIKQFERVFSVHIGLNPKKYLSIVRFQNVMQMKQNNYNANYIQLAFDNGYYDQSHFIRDFKSFTGVTPRVFFDNKI